MPDAAPPYVQLRRGGTTEIPVIQLRGSEWRDLLRLGLAFGWEPAGVTALRRPQPVIDPVSGVVSLTTPPGGLVLGEPLPGVAGYCATPCRMTADDARALADALVRSRDVRVAFGAAQLRSASEEGIDLL